jgi:hypothetical protein
LAALDEEEDAAFVRPAHTEEALPGLDSLAEGSQDELVYIAVHQSILPTFFHRTFLTRLFIIKNAF